MTETATILTSIVTARLAIYAEKPTLANIRLTLIQSSYGEEGVFYPAQDLCIYGTSLNKLRDLLNELPAQ